MRIDKSRGTILSNISINSYAGVRDTVVIRYAGADPGTMCRVIVAATRVKEDAPGVVVACRRDFHGWTKTLSFVDVDDPVIGVVGSYEIDMSMTMSDMLGMIGVDLDPRPQSAHDTIAVVHCSGPLSIAIPSSAEREIVTKLELSGKSVTVLTEPRTDVSSHWLRDRVVVPRNFDHMTDLVGAAGTVVATENWASVVAEHFFGMVMVKHWPGEFGSKHPGITIYKTRPLSRSV